LTHPSDPSWAAYGNQARDCKSLGELYIQHLEAHTAGHMVKEPGTGEIRPPDEALLARVERNVEGVESSLFRRRLMSHIHSYQRIGAEFHWDSNPMLEKALRRCIEGAPPENIHLRERKPAPYGGRTNAADEKSPDLSEFQLDGAGICVIRRLRVGIFGEFSAGKSTLINSLVGEEALSVSLVPETNRIEVLAHPGPRYRVRRPIRPKKDLRITEKHEKLFKLGLELWDTPGSNAEDPRHERLADKALEQVDVAIYLVRASDGITRTVQEKFTKIRDQLRSRHKPPPMVFLTRFDNLAEDLGDDEDSKEEINEVISEAAEQLGTKDKPWPIDCTNLNTFHGPKLLDWLETTVLDHGRRHFLEDLDIDGHPVRQHMALGGDWRSMVIAPLHTPETQRFFQSWEEECLLAATQRKRLRRSTYYRYFYHNLAEAWRTAKKEFAASMLWFTDGLKKSRDAPSQTSGRR